jgi:hypothetical protein
VIVTVAAVRLHLEAGDLDQCAMIRVAQRVVGSAMLDPRTPPPDFGEMLETGIATAENVNN